MDDDDLALAYFQGRLDPQHSAAFEAELSRRPDLQAELAVMSAAAKELGKLAEELPPKHDGWARLSDSIDREGTGIVANDNRRPAFIQFGAVAAAAILAWQFLAVPYLPTSQGGGDFVPASEIHASPILRVAFAQVAQISVVTEVLAASNATIINGPSALGVFELEFDSEAARQIAETLFMERADVFAIVSRP